MKCWRGPSRFSRIVRRSIRRSSIRKSPAFCSFRGQGGEEIVIGVIAAADGGTRVTGSSYLFDMQVARFFTTLPPWGVA